MLDEAAAAPTPPQAILGCNAALEKFRSMREMAGDDEELLQDCRAAMGEVFSQRGHQHRYARNHKEAVADLSQGLRLNPDLVDDYYYRALSYLKIGEEKQARNDLTQYLRYGKNEYMRQDAQARLDKLVPKEGTQQAAHLSKEGARLSSAAATLMNPREGQESDPMQAVAVYNQALEVFKKALELSPKDMLARMGMLAALAEQAECYIAIHEYDLAIDNLNRALEMKFNPQHLFRRAEAYRLAGQTQMARADFTEYLNKGADPALKEQARNYLSEKPKTGSANQ